MARPIKIVYLNIYSVNQQGDFVHLFKVLKIYMNYWVVQGGFSSLETIHLYVKSYHCYWCSLWTPLAYLRSKP